MFYCKHAHLPIVYYVMYTCVVYVSMGDFSMLHFHMWMICVMSFQSERRKKKYRFSLDLLDVIWCLVSALNHELVVVYGVTYANVNRGCGERDKKKHCKLCGVFFPFKLLFWGNKLTC